MIYCSESEGRTDKSDIGPEVRAYGGSVGSYIGKEGVRAVIDTLFELYTMNRQQGRHFLDSGSIEEV